MVRAVGDLDPGEWGEEDRRVVVVQGRGLGVGKDGDDRLFLVAERSAERIDDGGPTFRRCGDVSGKKKEVPSGGASR